MARYKITYKDGSSICQMSAPDMRVPIAHGLSENKRVPISFDELDFTRLNLSFQEFPTDRMEIQNIARQVCNYGSNYGVVFNAANEPTAKDPERIFRRVKLKFVFVVLLIPDFIFFYDTVIFLLILYS